MYPHFTLLLRLEISEVFMMIVVSTQSSLLKNIQTIVRLSLVLISKSILGLVNSFVLCLWSGCFWNDTEHVASLMDSRNIGDDVCCYMVNRCTNLEATNGKNILTDLQATAFFEI